MSLHDHPPSVVITLTAIWVVVILLVALIVMFHRYVARIS